MELKRLMDEYDASLRALPIAPYATIFGTMAVGKFASEKAYGIHPSLCVLLLILVTLFGFFVIKREKEKRHRNGVRLPIEIKRELRQKYKMSLEQARATLAKTYGPTVLDSLAADNRKRGRSIL